MKAYLLRPDAQEGKKKLFKASQETTPKSHESEQHPTLAQRERKRHANRQHGRENGKESQGGGKSIN